MVENETPKTISVGAIEYYETSIFREALEINVEDYPELAGMSEGEISEYIEQNSWEMKATDDLYSSLAEQLIERDVVRDKITNESSDIYAK